MSHLRLKNTWMTLMLMAGPMARAEHAPPGSAASLHATPQASGAWGAASWNWIRRYPGGAMSTGALNSLWGALQARKVNALLAFPDFKTVRALPNRHFKTGSIDVLFHQQPVRSPLLVFVPGIFNSLEDAFPLNGLANYSSRGYHVVVTPNPWGHSYIEHRPNFLPGDFVNEARVTLEIVREAVKAIGAENIGSIQLVGDSYGGFVVAAAAALDAESPSPIVTGGVTLFGPPVDFARTIARFDEMLDRDERIYRSKCAARLGYAAYDLASATRADQLAADTRECGEALLAYEGFQRRLIRSAQTLLNQGLVPAALNRTYSAERLDRLRFKEFSEHFIPANRKAFLMSDMSKLETWIRRAHDAGFKRIRVLTAKDDVLNDPRQWESLKWLGPEHLVILPSGGHIGFEGLDWFDDFLSASFQARKFGLPLSRLKIPDLNIFEER